MMYQIFSIVLSAIFLLLVFGALWYVILPVLAVMLLISAIGNFWLKMKKKPHKKKAQQIRAHDVIDVDFKEIS